MRGKLYFSEWIYVIALTLDLFSIIGKIVVSNFRKYIKARNEFWWLFGGFKRMGHKFSMYKFSSITNNLEKLKQVWYWNVSLIFTSNGVLIAVRCFFKCYMKSFKPKANLYPFYQLQARKQTEGEIVKCKTLLIRTASFME